MAISGQEFDAVCVAATPDDFAGLAFGMSWHKLQSEHVPDIDRSVRDDLGAARRDVHHEAFALRDSVVDRDPGRLLAYFPSRFARYLCPRLVNSHDEHPSFDLAAIG